MKDPIPTLIATAVVIAAGIGQAGAQQSSAGSTLQQGAAGRMGQGMMGDHMGDHMRHGAMMPMLFAIMDAGRRRQGDSGPDQDLLPRRPGH